MFYRLLLAPALVTLAACQTSIQSQAGSADAALGEATKYNAAVQTIDPQPVYAPGGAQPGDHGEKGANAVKRYRTDQVKQVEVDKTTSQATSAGGGPR